MKRKSVITLLSLVCLLCLSLALTACDTPTTPSTPPDGHEHSYQWVDNGDGTHKQHCSIDGCDAPDIDTEPHVWGTDDKCTKCPAVKPNGETPTPPATHSHEWSLDWQSNDTHHWHNCTAADCDVTDNTQKDGYAAHDFTNGDCVCGKSAPHSHNWSPSWQNDDTHHWHNCTADGCDVTDNTQKDGYGTHSYDSETHTCVCGKRDPSAPTEGLEYALNSDNESYYVKGIGTATDKDIVIASEYEGKPVTGIGDNAFKECLSLTSITIPDSVTNFGRYAFYGCPLLTSITIPDSVTSIGNNACFGLYVVYCEVTEKPSEWASNWNSSCPVVWDCKNNDKDKDGYAYALIDGIRYSLKDNVATVIRQPSNIITANIPASVTYKNATYNVTNIGQYAFAVCSFLTNISIPNSVASIKFGAFGNCRSLTSISIPDSVTSIGSSAFGDCVSLTNIALPDSVTSIGNGAFSGCTSLTGITLPNGMTNIKDDTFENCTSLTYISIPNGVSSIGEFAFSGCSSLTSISIPDSVTSIGSNAFSDCTSLTGITLPNGMRSIGSYAFRGCASLTSIALPDSVTSIGNRAFSGCTSLTSITIPNRVTNIGDSAFEGCTSLTNISIPNSVTSVGSYAFSGCTSLTSVALPDSVTSIGSCTFSGCTFI